jgi:hypothetical protein
MVLRKSPRSPPSDAAPLEKETKQAEKIVLSEVLGCARVALSAYLIADEQLEHSWVRRQKLSASSRNPSCWKGWRTPRTGSFFGRAPSRVHSLEGVIQGGQFRLDIGQAGLELLAFIRELIALFCESTGYSNQHVPISHAAFYAVQGQFGSFAHTN